MAFVAVVEEAEGCVVTAPTVSGWVWITCESHDPPEPYDWVTDLQSDRHCRVPHCNRRAVAKTMRAHGWWNYCPDHLYGRRIVGTDIRYRVPMQGGSHYPKMGAEVVSMTQAVQAIQTMRAKEVMAERARAEQAEVREATLRVALTEITSISRASVKEDREIARAALADASLSTSTPEANA